MPVLSKIHFNQKFFCEKLKLSKGLAKKDLILKTGQFTKAHKDNAPKRSTLAHNMASNYNVKKMRTAMRTVISNTGK